jgi:flagellar L-ring protein FlgH
MKSVLGVVVIAFALAGCSGMGQKLLDKPQLAPVGPRLEESLTTGSIDQPQTTENTSSWVGGPADYFRDAKAHQPGDLVTVNILVNDSATFSNSSARTRKSANTTSTDFDLGLFNILAQGKGEAQINGNAASSGQGSVIRSEKLKLQMTATIQRVLPNGHFVIEGSQQVLVNNEMRDVRVAGIVNPTDLSTDNAIEYHRMAEARVYYGGSGTVTTAQKPAWGAQLWDKIMPF